MALAVIICGCRYFTCEVKYALWPCLLLSRLINFRKYKKSKQNKQEENFWTKCVCCDNLLSVFFSKAFQRLLFFAHSFSFFPAFFSLLLPPNLYPAIFSFSFNYLCPSLQPSIHFTFLSCSLLFCVFPPPRPPQGQGSFCSRGASWMPQTGSTLPRFCCTISRMPAGRGSTSCAGDASWIPASTSVTPSQVSWDQTYQAFSQLRVEILINN